MNNTYNYPTFTDKSSLLTAEFMNKLVGNLNELNTFDGILDVSMANAVEGIPTKYLTLYTALVSVPLDVRKGGMTIKFINSDTNEYETYTSKNASFSTDPTEWVELKSQLTLSIVTFNGKKYLSLDTKKNSVSSQTTALCGMALCGSAICGTN